MGAETASTARNSTLEGRVNAMADPKKSPCALPAYVIVVISFQEAVQNDEGHLWQPEALFLANT
jgi:hypothetical protein